MIDAKNKKCTTCNLKQPTYNYPNETHRLYCSDCKLDETVDVKRKMCITCNKKKPCFNYQNEQTIRLQIL